MMTLDEVARYVSGLDGVGETERFRHRCWAVNGKVFAWERPFSKADIKRFGDEPVPEGDIVAVSVADLNDKEAVLAEGTPGVFTIPHFDGYPAVLVHLRAVPKKAMRELLRDGHRLVT